MLEGRVLASTSTTAELLTGSQLYMRTVGILGDPAKWPIRSTVSLAEEPTGTRVTIRLVDDMKVGIRTGSKKMYLKGMGKVAAELQAATSGGA